MWVGTGNVATFTFWETAQPDNMGGRENCGDIIQRWGHTNWNDRNCNSWLGRFICEVS